MHMNGQEAGTVMLLQDALMLLFVAYPW